MLFYYTFFLFILPFIIFNVDIIAGISFVPLTLILTSQDEHFNKSYSSTLFDTMILNCSGFVLMLVFSCN